MAYFGESLVGIASEWYMDQDMSRWHIWDDLARDFIRQFQYNIDIAPNRNFLSNLKKKSSKSFREYTVKWCEQTARVKPSMDETEMVSVILQDQKADYFQNVISAMGKPFVEAIKIGEMVENGLKTGRILSQSAIRATSQAIQSGSGGVANRKKKEEVAMSASSLRNPHPPKGYFPPSTPQHYYPHQDVAYVMAPQPRAIKNLIEQKRVVLKDEEIPNMTNNPLSTHNNGLVIGMIYEYKEFDPALKAIIAIADFEKRTRSVAKQGKGEKKSNSTPQNEEKTVENKTGAVPPKDAIFYVPRAHRKEQLVLSPPKRFELNKGPKMRYFNLEEVNNAKQKRFLLKKLVSAEEAEEFFRRMKTADYEKVLIKTLNEAYVPIETTVEKLERMAERFFAVHQVSFSKNDLPPEGGAHNKALHLTVKCEGYYVKRGMLDGGSGVDICPLSTLQRMDIGSERIRPNNVCVRAFDGIKRDTIGEIDLILTIGPIDFEVTFQVLDMNTSYNFLLGKPWIHAVGVVPSTLHKMVKFEHEDQEIVVHGEDEQSIYRDSSVPCPEAREGSEHIVYQAFEVVVADQCEEGSPCPQPFLSNASIMVATKMIKHGYNPGKGLRESLQGITEPITPVASEKFFGVGFYATETDLTWENE
ncbi:uncharacterized protein [Nicotiana sylvestris]|uniref:uncharacterized protein n=1 Tax=Nicotiana sylvestris TaxID=4096 RepID=UPI00388CAB01